jgi:hypothetical protein
VRIKIDENIGGSGVAILKQGGHDVMTVREQGLAGAVDASSRLARTKAVHW